MKSLTAIILLGSALVVATGCKKKGDFTTDKAVYKQGEVIYVTNTTEKDAKNYTWTFGGKEVTGKNPIYTIPESTPVGTFEISILPHNFENTSDSWKRTTMSVTIEEAEKAQVMFYLPTPRTGNNNETFTVSLNGESMNGSVYGNIPSPSCESSNSSIAVIDNLPSGEYTFTISGSSSSGNYSLSGTVELEDGFSCERINVTSL